MDETAQDYVKPDNAKFNNYVLAKFRKYEEEMTKIEERDCTFYRKETKECGRKIISLFPYQKLVRDFVTDKSPYRGLLVYHMLGSGKTFTAVSVCENIDRQVIVILPAALKNDWIEHIIKFACDKYNITLDEWEQAKKNKRIMKILMAKINKKYKFVSINAPNSRKILEKMAPLDNHLIAVDECHHLSHQVMSEGSKNGGPIYDMIMNAKNIKVLMLSATPLVGDPYELAITFNILRGYMHIPGERRKFTAFPSDYKEFSKYFVDRVNNRIINKNIFQERINGLVSYYKGIKDPNNLIFPTKIGPDIINLPMSDHQWRLYSKFREKELDEERFMLHSKKEFKAGPFKKPARSSVTSYRNKSRQGCNFILPFKDASGHKFEYGIKRDKHEWNKTLASIKKNDLKVKNLHNYSPKGDYIFKRIDAQDKGLIVVYSDFVTFGVNIMALIFRENGWTEYKGDNEPEVYMEKRNRGGEGKDFKTFSVLSGDVEHYHRAHVLSLFKKSANKYGKYVRVLFVSSMAAEGFSLRNVREMHLLEPYWQDIRLQQVMGRAIRICSHYDLPPNERTVKYFLYLMKVPDGIDAVKLLNEKNNHTTDETIYYHALQKQALLDEFLTAVKEIAIDCKVFAKQNFDKKLKKCVECRDPNTTDPVYYQSITKHMMHGNSSCISRSIDYLEGPKWIKKRMYVYDPFSNDVYLVCKLHYVGKINLKVSPIRIEKPTKDTHKLKDDVHNMEDILIINKKFCMYDKVDFNTYVITKISGPVGHYDPDEQKIMITDKIDESQCFYSLKQGMKTNTGGKTRKKRSRKKSRRRKA